MRASLCFQDPIDPGSPCLHEALLDALNGAKEGKGAFSFVTSQGARLLLEDHLFLNFIHEAPFNLVIGVDEITNREALRVLQMAMGQYTNLDIKVFCHDLDRELFHPKFCWFRKDDGATLIVGSGNMTAQGMRGNWEAYCKADVPVDEAERLTEQWRQWLNRHDRWLRPVDAEEVLRRAEQNEQNGPPPSHGQRGVPPPSTERYEALLAEIPRSGDRWHQANFNLETFTGFFGAQPGVLHRVVFQHVNSDGRLGRLENRPSVAVASRNWRFELDAGADKPYPENGRPIAVFARMAARSFRYHLLMPSSADYSTAKSILDAEMGTNTTEVRRYRTDVGDLKVRWPSCPLLLRELEFQD